MSEGKIVITDKLKVFLLALFSTLAIKYSEYYFRDISNPIENSSFIWTIIFVLFYIVYKKYYFQNIEFNKTAAILATIFSLILCIGNCFKLLEEFNLIKMSSLQVSFLLIEFLGYIAIFYLVFQKLFEFFNIKLRLLIDFEENKVLKIDSKWKRILSEYDKHVFLYSFLIIYICWLPYIIISFPGSMSYDAAEQLFRFTGNAPVTNHHPILSTLLIGICFRVGQFIHSDNFGIFIYMIFQSLIFALALAYMLKYMKELKIILKWRIVTLLFFSLFSLWPMYAQWVVKDTLFCSLVIFYVVYCIRIVVLKDFKNSNVMFFKVFIISLLVTLLRNNGIYLVVLSLPFISILETVKKNRIKLYISTFGILVVYILFNNVLAYLNIEGSSIKEMLSVPFQQTANYVRTYPNEVTEREKEIIDTILDYDAIQVNYNPSLSDPVKETFKGKNMNSQELKEAMKNYFLVWGQQFLKHPLNYIMTTFSNTYNYYYPENKHVAWTSHVHVGNEFMDDHPGFTEIHQLKIFEEERNALNTIYYTMNNMPIIGMFDYTGTYTWLYVLCIIILIKQKRAKYIVPLLPGIVTILVALVSPVNGTTRYMLPAMAILPIILAYTIYIIGYKNAINADK